jgi:NADH dehydrogenase
VIWAAGVFASPAGRWVKAETDRAGRVLVAPDLSVPGHPDVFVIGDAAHVKRSETELVPGVAPAAMQEGRYVAEVIRRRLAGKAPPPPFAYVDKGNLATVGRKFAIADFGKFRLSGFFGWLFWLGLHIFFLIGFRNRLLVLIQWAWAYLTYERGARLIIQEPPAEPTEPRGTREMNRTTENTERHGEK